MGHKSVIGAIFSADRKEVLLIQRRDVPVWVLPGGGVEENEAVEKAALREVWEETGYRAEIARKVGEYQPANRLSRYTYLFECRIIEGEATTGAETRAIRFFPLDRLPKLLPPPYGDWIADTIKNEPFLIQKKLTQVNYSILLKHLFLHPILIFRFLLSKIGLTINT